MTLDEAIAVFDKSADRTRPNAQTEAWAVIRAELANARRYRWLRALDGSCDGDACVNFNIGFDWIEQHGDELDAAVDAAIATTEQAHEAR